MIVHGSTTELVYLCGDGMAWEGVVQKCVTKDSNHDTGRGHQCGGEGGGAALNISSSWLAPKRLQSGFGHGHRGVCFTQPYLVASEGSPRVSLRHVFPHALG